MRVQLAECEKMFKNVNIKIFENSNDATRHVASIEGYIIIHQNLIFYHLVPLKLILFVLQ